MKKEKRQRKRIELVFTQDYAGKKEGESGVYDPSLGHHILKAGVAVKKGEDAPAPEFKSSKPKKSKKNEKDN